MLSLADPAFGRATSEAAIIARTIPVSQIQILPMREAWPQKSGEEVGRIVDSVDWSERHLVVRVTSADRSEDLKLDLLGFECLARAADGYVAEGFYAHDLRRIRNFLGRLAEQGRTEVDQIRLFMGGSMHTVSVDDGMIQVAGGT
jgi:hypothetical protein